MKDQRLTTEKAEEAGIKNDRALGVVVPVRVQRKRSKGWKMPGNTVYVGRPTKWGNPFMAYNDGQRVNSVIAFRDFIGKLLKREARDLSELRGKNFACWCRLDQPCHADVLLELANPQ